MPNSPAFCDLVLERLGTVAPVSAKPSLGGIAIYAGPLHFGLIINDRLYFVVDELTRPEYERLGMRPPRGSRKRAKNGYYQLPAHVLEDPEELALWMSKAVNVAAYGQHVGGGQLSKPKARRGG
jgi:DNA transformation protein